MIEGKLKSKVGDLQRREKKIIHLEEELKHRLTEVSKELLEKEEEIAKFRKK